MLESAFQLPVTPLLLAGLLAFFNVSEASSSTYQIIGHIPVTDARWDYGAVDTEARRLYIGRFGGVLAVDLDSGAVTPQLVRSALVHGVLPLGRGLVICTDGEANTATVFEGASGRIVTTIPTGRGPDAVVREPLTGLVITTNEASRDLTLIDPVGWRAVGAIALPGSPEFPATGAHGILYDNLSDLNAIAVIDVRQRRVLRTYPLAGCDGPTGIAYDMAADLLLSVCRNGIAKFLRGRDGQEIATLDVGRGPDAAFFDVAGRLAFVPAGGAGTLTVINVAGGRIAKVQTLQTQTGSRTAVFDPKADRIYIPAARFTGAKKPGDQPTATPGSFEILVVGREAGRIPHTLSSATGH